MTLQMYNVQLSLRLEESAFTQDWHTLHKIPYFHIISCSGNFVETHSFSKVSGELPETLHVFPQNFHTRKFGEILVFYADLYFILW